MMVNNQLLTMLEENKKVKYLIYPENPIYTYWDLLMTILLVFSCLVTPVQIALFENMSKTWHVVNYTIDILFLIDIFVNFNLASYNDDMDIIDDRC